MLEIEQKNPKDKNSKDNFEILYSAFNFSLRSKHKATPSSFF